MKILYSIMLRTDTQCGFRHLGASGPTVDEGSLPVPKEESGARFQPSTALSSMSAAGVLVSRVHLTILADL